MTVCSGFHPAGYAQYGKRFLATFHKHWPAEVNLVVYAEEKVKVPRGECRSLWACAGARDFYEKHKDVAEHCGRKVRQGWREKDKERGYCYRFDSVKFFKQLMIPEAAAEGLETDSVLVWLDADVFTFADVPLSLVPDMLGDADVCYLGRPGTHSEIGFWAVRLNARTRKFLFDLAEIYRSGEVFALREWHSAFVFDHVRQQNERFGLKGNNITPKGRRHVWFQSPLAKYADHVKGDARKQLGFSPVHTR